METHYSLQNANDCRASARLFRLGIVLTVLLAAAVLFTGAAMAEEQAVTDSGTSGGIVWTVENDILTISPNPAAEPEEYGVMPEYASAVDVPWFSHLISLSSVVIEDGVKNIGNYAFKSGGFTSVAIPGSIKSIGDEAFYRAGLTSVILPDSLESIGKRAFYGTYLTSITIPKSVTGIGDRAFANCEELGEIRVDSENMAFIAKDGVLFTKDMTGLICYPMDKSAASYTVPDGVKQIDDYAFYGNEKLAGVIFPNGVNTIGTSAFFGCCSLTGTITIPDSVETIGSSAFESCSALTEVSINPEKSLLKSIGNNAFYSCTNLRSVFLPNSLENIGMKAFSSTNLSNITIPKSVAGIGEQAFADCRTLAEIRVDGENMAFTANEGVLFTRDMTRLICYPMGKSADSYTVPDGVKQIDDYAFYGNENLTGVILPNGVETIGASAFFGCSSLTDITIPDSVETIGNYAFESCDTLTGVSINQKNSLLKSIGNWAFSKCSSLTGTITIPDGVEAIGNHAFDSCSALTGISIDKEQSKLKSIGDWAFSDCSSLTGTITIPDSVVSIGESAFLGCSHLTNIRIPDSVKTIGNNAFYFCSALTNITIPNSVESVGYRAFSCCSSLQWVVLPNSSVSLGQLVFDSIGEGSIIYFAGNSVDPLNDCYNPSVTAIALMNGGTLAGEVAQPPMLTGLTKRGYTFTGWVNAKGEPVTEASPSDSPFTPVFVAKKSSSGSQGTSIWLTETPALTPTVTPIPTPVPTQEVPTVKPTAEPIASPASPAPFIGLLAGLGAAAVVFGLRRK